MWKKKGLKINSMDILPWPPDLHFSSNAKKKLAHKCPSPSLYKVNIGQSNKGNRGNGCLDATFPVEICCCIISWWYRRICVSHFCVGRGGLATTLRRMRGSLALLFRSWLSPEYIRELRGRVLRCEQWALTSVFFLLFIDNQSKYVIQRGHFSLERGFHKYNS